MRTLPIISMTGAPTKSNVQNAQQCKYYGTDSDSDIKWGKITIFVLHKEWILQIIFPLV